MTQELRKLAEEADAAMTYEWEWIEFKQACTPDAILSLLDRLEAAEKDAARWRYAVAIGGNQVMNWLDVYYDWEGEGGFTAQIDSAMEVSK